MARKLSAGTHTIRIKKPSGGTRLQRVRVLKSGKFRFIKNKPRRKAAKRKSRASKPKRRRRAKAAKGGRFMGIGRPRNVYVATLLGLIKALVFPFGSNIDRARMGDWAGIVDATMAGLIGFNTQGEWNPSWLMQGTVPILLGAGASVAASKLGLNKRIALGTQGVPLLNRIRI